MKTKLPILALCVGALSVTSPTFAEEGKDRDDAWFNHLDTDGDGLVSKKEYVDTWNAYFAQQDTNKNKHLDFGEWSKHDRAQSRSVSGKVYARKIFNQWDKDGDGQISGTEYVTFRSNMFENSDTNKDGYWSQGQSGEKIE